MTPKEQLESCYRFVSEKISFVPKIALVLGSGLGAFADKIQVTATLNYADIPNFPVSTVAGHAGRFVFGICDGVPVAVMQGRVHMYEGYTPQEAVLPIRILHLLGAKILFLTNAAGGIQPGMKAGEFMLLTDQISSFVPSPLRGENIETLGVRFPDMSEIYSKRLNQIIRRIALNEDIPLKEGVYLQTAGPAYESPAEIRMFRTLGADAVGMSTAIEAIAARHCGMEICGVSCISNLAAGISPTPLSHEEVKEAGDKAAPQFEKLVRTAIAQIAELTE
ncbi:MAG: purine-nucleoside phosphorylase [Oscillospiraceae bacterium]|nr:purine-nucleoside phosphorylase [Oscillospiraceae bacterium]